ncbi:MAG: hypothetical protein OEM05_15285 [Myxococcales bacterium]|nr:hypothetical protein [Myxococcales bacterium]
MHIRIAGSLAALLLIANAGCLSELTDPLGRRSALKEAQLKYTQAIRWGNLDRASEFVDPELRATFLSFAEEFATIRITDYDIGSIHYESKDRADVTVTYHAYNMGTFIDRSVREEQRWHREGAGTRWWVNPEIETLVGALGVSAQ